MIRLPRRGGGGVEWGGDACIALGGAFFACNPRLVLEPSWFKDKYAPIAGVPVRNWQSLVIALLPDSSGNGTLCLHFYFI